MTFPSESGALPGRSAREGGSPVQFCPDFLRSERIIGEKYGLEESAVISPQKSADILAIDEALKKLAIVDPRKSQIVELRYFGGLTVEETAEALNLAQSTIYHDYDLAKLWLLREITGHSQ